MIGDIRKLHEIGQPHIPTASGIDIERIGPRGPVGSAAQPSADARRQQARRAIQGAGHGIGDVRSAEDDRAGEVHLAGLLVDPLVVAALCIVAGGIEDRVGREDIDLGPRVVPPPVDDPQGAATGRYDRQGRRVAPPGVVVVPGLDAIRGVCGRDAR